MNTQTETPALSNSPARDLVSKLYESFLENDYKFTTKGTALAAARARKALSNLAKACKPARKEVQIAKVAKVAEKRAAKLAAKA